MMNCTICGCEECSRCEQREKCGGCAETDGRPFGCSCILAECCHGKGLKDCGECPNKPCGLKTQIMKELNALEIPDLPRVKATDLTALPGSYINLEYTLENGQKVKLLDDRKYYLGAQLCRASGEERCYGIAADEGHLLVCEYGEGGSDPAIVLYRRR